MYTVDVSNSQSAIQVADAVIIQTVCDVLKAQQVQNAEIVVALVGDETIHKVNRDYLNHDFPTDVISFLYDHSRTTSEASVLRGAGLILDGEIVISTQTAVREAAEYGWQPLDELRLYIAHGLLHLCGYDDLTEDEQLIMREQERSILNIWNLMPHYD